MPVRMIATFHTHFGAMSFQKKLEKAGRSAGMMPVPRALSASCGVCVRFDGPFDTHLAVSDLEAVYQETPGGGYELVYRQEE